MEEDENAIGDQEMLYEEDSTHKSKEIQSLAKSINDLAVLFKDLSVLVVEQGTVLDRIDYNIHEAKESTAKANVHLEKTVKMEKSTRSRNCILFLAIMIFILASLLILKWSS